MYLRDIEATMECIDLSLTPIHKSDHLCGMDTPSDMHMGTTKHLQPY